MKTKNFFRRGLLLFLCIALFCGSRASAAIFTVTDTNDSIRISSLRGAIIAANRTGGNNTIYLGTAKSPKRNQQQQQWVFRLTISGADENAARTGDLDITRGNLTIIGVNSNVTIDAFGLGDRIFQVFPNARLTFQNVTLKNGTAPADNFQDADYYKSFGGAIFNSGMLTMQNCSVTENLSGQGGIVADFFAFSEPGG